MNKSQIAAVNETMMKRLHSFYQKLNSDEAVTDPTVAKLVAKGKALLTEANELNKMLEKKYKNQAYTHISNIGSSYSSFKGLETSSTNTVYVNFAFTGGVSFCNHKLAAQAQKDIAKVEDYILRLTLGTSTVDEMESLLKSLVK